MTFQLYVVYDKLAEKYVHLFVEDNDATAQRVFGAWVDSMPMPESFVLYNAGFWHNDSGLVEGTQLAFIANGAKA